MTDFTAPYKQLLQDRERLERELKNLEVESTSADEQREGSPFGKREEGATEAMEFEKRLALQKQLVDTLAKVNRAIQKYEANTYGICDLCGKPIEPARLEALPYAALCMSCKSNQNKNVQNRLSK